MGSAPGGSSCAPQAGAETLADQSPSRACGQGAVLVVGGGVAGLQSSLDLADSGFRVVLVERSPALGGVMAQLDKTFPTNDCSMCILAPKLVEAGRHPNIQLLTLTELESLEGEPGRMVARLRKHARFVDESLCNGCGECALHCPVSVPSEFDQGLAQRKAIYRPYPQAIPNLFAIDKRGTPPCRATCPLGVNAQGFIALMRERKYARALNLIREKNPLPAICGRVCHRPCETQCRRGDLDQPIAVASLRRFLTDWEQVEGVEWTPPPVAEATGRKVAVVGSGPAGLTAAYDLALRGHTVTLFEATATPGGLLAHGIPEYRLPADVLSHEVERILSVGIELRLKTALGRDFSLDGLQAHGFDGVVLAVGARDSSPLGVEGEEDKGVLHALEFLRQLRADRAAAGAAVQGKRVAIVGGGNAAIDAARSSLRLGAKEVTMLYRRTCAEMPASVWEIEEAEREGVRIEFLVAPKAVARENDSLAIELQRMELGEPDASGRRRPVPIAGSEFIYKCDVLIPAIGQKAEALALQGLELTRWGTVAVDETTMATSRPGVFAAGDVVEGGGTVTESMAAGRKAAAALDAYLRGEGFTPPRKPAVVAHPELAGRQQAARALMPSLPVEERLASFAEVESGFDEERALEEATRCLQCGTCCECLECVRVCKADAIRHHQVEEVVEVPVGGAILAVGSSTFDPKLKSEYGYGRYPNVVTSLEFERILSASGPFGGHIKRLSDGRTPKRIAFLQCVGSRDQRCGREYCSAVCCMYAVKEAVIAREHERSIEPTIFFMDLRAYGKDFDRYVERAQAEYGMRVVRTRIPAIEEDSATHDLLLPFETDDGVISRERYDMVVLSVGLSAPQGAGEMAQRLGFELNDWGFARMNPDSPLEATRPGVFVCGTFAGPKDIPETVMEASAAAAKVGELLAPYRGTEVTKKEYPPERDVKWDKPRIGVFVCHCGINIGGVVNVPAVVEHAKTLPYVVYAEENLYTCSQDSQERIRQTIIENRLNRVVVASCSPRTHESLFQETVREAGLNPYLFEMANIRDQCSWVHAREPEAATEKSKDLMRMAVAKASFLTPLTTTLLPVAKSALVLGGGPAGMTAALELANQGFTVNLIEREAALGGNLRRLRWLLPASVGDEAVSVGALTEALVDGVAKHPNIAVHLSSQLQRLSGHVGSFNATVGRGSAGSVGRGSHDPAQGPTEGLPKLRPAVAEGGAVRRPAPNEVELEAGVIVVATGAAEERPAQYHLDEDPRAMTQEDFEERLADGTLPANVRRVVMIQCVGSRDEDRPYCSRVCCQEAVKNALAFKRQNPKATVTVLYRDLRTYGFAERFYEEARRQGVVFLRYDRERPPRVAEIGEKLNVHYFDPVLQRELPLAADLVVLSVPTAPLDGNHDLAQMLKVPLNADGFFLEAHVKLRPVDFATEGVFVAGTAHGPKLVREAMTQARAAAARAARLLSQEGFVPEARVATSRREWCSRCGTCTLVCPYEAVRLDEALHVSVVNEALCKGCGACAAGCRSGALVVQGTSSKQIAAAVESLLMEDG